MNYDRAIVENKSGKAVVCTLYEDHYHHGVAALVNSLYRYGFRGHIYIGYRGVLPPWAGDASEDTASGQWPGACRLDLFNEIKLYFLPVKAGIHFANYKPTFMLRLWEVLVADSEAIAYFDPDIVIKCRWDFYTLWMQHGVALVHEIVSNDMPVTHPIRMEWRKVIKMCGQQENREINSYINSGFCGVSRKHIEFINLWEQILEVVINNFGYDPTKLTSFDKTFPFHFLDQDSFNVAAMCSQSPVSAMGPEGMDFVNSGWTMSHATGSPKPWKKNFISSAFKGIQPSLAEKAYWLNATGIINSHVPMHVKRKKLAIGIARLIGRFYKR